MLISIYVVYLNRFLEAKKRERKNHETHITKIDGRDEYSINLLHFMSLFFPVKVVRFTACGHSFVVPFYDINNTLVT